MRAGDFDTVRDEGLEPVCEFAARGLALDEDFTAVRVLGAVVEPVFEARLRVFANESEPAAKRQTKTQIADFSTLH